MSFTPLPKTFTDLCGSLDPAHSRTLELGCGDGRFHAVVSELGLDLWGLDLAPPDRGTAADIVGDACEPPVIRGSLDLVVAANLVRHLAASRGNLEFMKQWLALLKPGGSLFLFEDEPDDHQPGAANYRDLQDFLKLLVPEARGALLPVSEFLALSSTALPQVDWEHGLVRNLHPVDSAAVLEFLGGAVRSDEKGRINDHLTPGRLMRNISRDGLDLGHFWWARAVAAREG